MDDPLTFDALLQAHDSDTRLLVAPDGATLTVADFDTRAGQAAAWLHAQGIQRGDRVALWHPNGVDWLALLFGAARIGAMIVAVNTRYKAADLHHVLDHSGARMLIFGAEGPHADVRAILQEVDLPSLPDLEQLAAFEPQDPIQSMPVTLVDPETAAPLRGQGATAADPVLLFTTSGTTSKPKLVEHTQGTLARHALNCATAYGFDRPGAAYLAALPFCGVFGLNPTLAAIAGAAPIHILTVFEDAKAVAAARDGQVTHFFGSDEMFRRMWAFDQACFAHARVCGYATFTPGLGEKLQEMASAGVPLAGLYGASEVNAIFAIQPFDLPLKQRMEGGGRMSGTGTIRVRDPESGALLPAGETGVIEIKADTNFTGYFRNPEATRKAIGDDGFFNTNDIGQLREDGSFVYLSRNGEFIRLSGFLTDPAEIEEVIGKAPGVAKAQVVGVEHEGRMRPVAFVIAQGADGADAASWRSFTETRLAHYKVPYRFFRVDAFPTTDSANGLKIQRSRLVAMARDMLMQKDPL